MDGALDGMTALAFRAARRPAKAVMRPLLVVLLGALAVLGAQRLPSLLPGLPFGTETVDRSAPAVLHALEDVSRYEAARANYSVIVDIEQDTRWVPSFIKGERTVLVAQGAVPATVDLGALDQSAIEVDGEAVTIRLPEAKLGSAQIDLDESRIVSRQRGLIDRLGSVLSSNPGNESEMLRTAQARLDRAARADDALVVNAEANTRQMLERLLEPLGFTQVTVVFGDGR